MPTKPTPPSPLVQVIREEIEHGGPLHFEKFMELALYHPQYGYYLRGSKPVGRGGDFFTASQLQPLYGMLVRRYVERVCEVNGFAIPPVITEYGAGKGEMAEGFANWEYHPVEVGSSPPNAPLTGLIFANELFDAIPVNVGVRQNGRVHEQLVVWNGERFTWTEDPPVSAELEGYASRHGVPDAEGFTFECHARGLNLLRSLLHGAKNALFVFVDYGFTRREWKRFPAGSLMSYAKHQALEDVLAAPGERDITSHVPFEAMMNVAREEGGEVVRMERLAMALLFAGEPDSFQSVLNSDNKREQFDRRQQLKTLLYGLGESFYVLAIGRK